MQGQEIDTLRRFADAARTAANAATDYYEAAGRTEQAHDVISGFHEMYDKVRRVREAAEKSLNPHRRPRKDRSISEYRNAQEGIRTAARSLSPFEMMNELVTGGGVNYNDIMYWLNTYRGENREMVSADDDDDGEARTVRLEKRLIDVLRILKTKTTDQDRATKLQGEIDTLDEGLWNGPVSELFDIDDTPTCPTCGLDVPGPHPPAGTDPHTTPHVVD